MHHIKLVSNNNKVFVTTSSNLASRTRNDRYSNDNTKYNNRKLLVLKWRSTPSTLFSGSYIMQRILLLARLQHSVGASIVLLTLRLSSSVLVVCWRLYDTIRYDTVDLCALKSWRDAQLNLAHGPETKNNEKIKIKNRVAQKKRCRQKSVEAVREVRDTVTVHGST